jgi:hypothetical protein
MYCRSTAWLTTLKSLLALNGQAVTWHIVLLTESVVGIEIQPDLSLLAAPAGLDLGSSTDSD